MLELFHQMSDWLVDFADSGWAVVALVAASFTESIFFPVPPDPLLIGMSILNPNAAFWFAALATVSSVAGAVVGHWLGLRFGRPLLRRFPSARVESVERLFKRYGVWAVLLAAITPLPYKLFAILAGVLDLDRRLFIIFSLIGRGSRFFALAVLVFFYGEEIESFIQDNFETVTIATAAAILAGLAIFGVLYHRRRTKSATQ